MYVHVYTYYIYIYMYTYVSGDLPAVASGYCVKVVIVEVRGFQEYC